MNEPCRCLEQDYSREYKYKGLGSRMFLVFETKRPVVLESVLKRKIRKEVRKVMEASLCVSYRPL